MDTGWNLKECCSFWRKISGDSAEARFCFPSALPGFAGHFPLKPVLPAVIQLQAVHYLAELLCNCPIAVRQYSMVKFKMIVEPDEMVHLKLSLKQNDGEWSGHFVLSKTDGKSAAQGSMVFSCKK